MVQTYLLCPIKKKKLIVQLSEGLCTGFKKSFLCVYTCQNQAFVVWGFFVWFVFFEEIFFLKSVFGIEVWIQVAWRVWMWVGNSWHSHQWDFAMNMVERCIWGTLTWQNIDLAKFPELVQNGSAEFILWAQGEGDVCWGEAEGRQGSCFWSWYQCVPGNNDYSFV